MRRIYYASLLCFVCILLGGCYEITEDICIDPSGKGVFVTHIDMGQLLSLIKTYAAADTNTNKELSMFNQDMDSTVFLKDVTDTSQALDPATKALMAKASARIVIRSDSNIFTLTIRAPFDNLQDLQKLQNQFSRSGSGLQSMANMLGGKGEDQQGLGPDQLTNVLSTAWSDHQIKRTLNRPLYDSLMKDSTIQQVKQMAAVMGDAKFNTIIHLPRPVKTVDSKASMLSNDRKTVTIERSMTDLFFTPEDFTFTIDY